MPFKNAHAQNIHGDGDKIDNPNGDQLGFVGFSRDHKNSGTEKMEIADEKNQPHSPKGSAPEGIFPDQVTAYVQEDFNKDTEGGIADGPEPHVRDAQYFSCSVFVQGMVIDNPQDGKHEHDFNVPAHHGS
mgnify:CR=1 FL=1